MKKALKPAVYLLITLTIIVRLILALFVFAAVIFFAFFMFMSITASLPPDEQSEIYEFLESIGIAEEQKESD